MAKLNSNKRGTSALPVQHKLQLSYLLRTDRDLGSVSGLSLNKNLLMPSTYDSI